MHGRFLQTIYFFCIQISSILESQFNINRHFAFSREDERDSGNNAEIWQFYLLKSIFILKVFFETSNPTREWDCFEFILPSVMQSTRHNQWKSRLCWSEKVLLCYESKVKLIIVVIQLFAVLRSRPLVKTQKQKFGENKHCNWPGEITQGANVQKNRWRDNVL